MRNPHQHLLDPASFRARNLASALQQAASAFHDRGVPEPQLQEIWALVRELTPLLLPGPLPDHAAFRAKLDDVERRFLEVCRRAGVPVRSGPLDSPQIRALTAQRDEVRARLLRFRRSAAAGEPVSEEDWVRCLEEWVRLEMALGGAQLQAMTEESREGIIRIGRMEEPARETGES